MVTQGASLLVSWVTGLLTVTLTQHLQVNNDTFVNTNRVDLECLSPLTGIFGTFDNLNLGSEGNLGANLES